MWVQEEPLNMGAWSYVDRRIETASLTVFKHKVPVRVVARKPSAATATGSHKNHEEEFHSLMRNAFAH